MKKGALTGLLLFGIFFGAANLIFPPSLGALSGDQFWPAVAGFVVSGVGIAVLTLIIGTLNPKGYVYEISRKISPLFATVYLVALYLAIGPFFAIPRTAATSFDMGIAPLLSNGGNTLALLIFTLLYFLAAYAIALRPSKILDSIGRILTPVFALLIIILVVMGIFKYGANAPLPASEAYTAGKAFGTGFIEGYNTLDALASVAFSVIAVNTLKQFGLSSKKEYMTTIWIVGILVALAFSILYIGLAYLGNHFPVPADVMASDANKGVYILSQATQHIFGPAAQIFLALMVTVTCFTTTVGLIVSTGEFFAERFPQLSYKVYATVFTLIGFAIANLGLTKIIAYSIPVLLVLYPITICIVLIIIANKFFPLSIHGMRLTVGIVLFMSLLEVLAGKMGWTSISIFFTNLPLGAQSLAWLLPAITGITLSLFLPHKQESEEFEL
ncbi:branched-chain amino acid transport system II carrier protein [Streptococcus marmotae]|uniref:branched-chain amino acid transport system II carrier protein n=1 Tax=Streptococcus marmotae TaxID=1825069 RepID=UPI000831B7F5|nr:branched-chain amino acid transport system II carrier protein [Streptococcus marmotae]